MGVSDLTGGFVPLDVTERPIHEHRTSQRRQARRRLRGARHRPDVHHRGDRRLPLPGDPELLGVLRSFGLVMEPNLTVQH
ncbi:MAG: hypothetical protein ABR922_09615 [Streptosporangiaceae bacterium]|jgi:hypothetical protein